MLRKIEIKNLLLNISLGLLALFFFFLAISFDSIHRSWGNIFKAIFHYNKNNIIHFAIVHRILILTAMMACISALSVAGLLLQRVTRNALASPGVMGMMGSIKMGATILSFSGFGLSLITKQFILIIFGAIPLLIILLSIIFSKRKMSGLSMIFVGISMGVVFSSIEWFVMYNNEEGGLFISTFLESNFRLVKPKNLLFLSLTIIIPIFIAIFLSRKFTILNTGDEMSTATGNNANVLRITAFILVLIMVPASVLLGGNLLFAGIIAPNFAKILIRNKKFFPTIIATIFIGIIIIMLTAIIGSYLPIHVSALLDIIAAPIFIIIARRVND